MEKTVSKWPPLCLGLLILLVDSCGHKPRMAAMDDPEIVIEKIIEACIDPKEKMPVGPNAGASNFFHQVFPDFTERGSAKLAKTESEKAEPASHSTGGIYEHM